ncbi:MAG: hypothetical protein CMD23_02200 [Flavobacteriales bacterium]|nr:hypothetical protein [Flavobacteriales bacterium]|tara:strand:+ start:409 stop:771 length:363 start_codon:yes stop_codon:yes gene_type:complete
MKAYKASLINSLTLIIFGLWGAMSYFQGTTESWTPLIPVIFGVIILICNNGLKKENKIIAHIAVLLTVLVFIGLFKPFTSQINKGDIIGVSRVAIMMCTCIIAMVSFVKSFKDARKQKKS